MHVGGHRGHGRRGGAWTPGGAAGNRAGGKSPLSSDTGGNARGGVGPRLSGAPLRYGFDRQGVREVPNLLFTNRKIALQPEDRHVSQKYLRVVGAPPPGRVAPGAPRRGS